MLANLKIIHKVYLMGFIQTIFIALIGIIGLTTMSKIGTELIDIAEEDIPISRSLTLLTEHQLQQTILFERALLKGVYSAQSNKKNHSEFINLQAKVNDYTNKINIEIKQLQAFVEKSIGKLHSQKAAQKFSNLLSSLKAIETQYNQIQSQIGHAFSLIENGNIDDGVKKATEIEKLIDSLDHELVSILNDIQDFTLQSAITAEHDEQAGIKTISVTFGISLLVAIILPFLIGHSIANPIKMLSVRLSEVADGDGDLTLKLEESAKDETGDAARAFNRFMAKLRRVIGDVNSCTDTLGDSSDVAMQEMKTTLNNVELQQAETEMVATAIEEMSRTTQDVAQNTAEAANIAEMVMQRVSEGRTAADETHSIIEQLSQEVANTSAVIKNLSEETKNIGTVLDAIRGIAEQTNLLALNAAIEAARAGDTGRGFAVVADEVRSLAQRTQSSTGDIQKLVETLQNEAKNAVQSMQKGSDNTARCLEKSSETAQAFDDATEAVTEITSLNIQIATATEEQSSVVEEINNNLLNIKHAAEKTTSKAQKASGANEQITERLLELEARLAQFNI